MKRVEVFLLILLPLNLWAKGDDFGIWSSLEAEKKLGKRWSVSLETEYRTRDHAGTSDRWSIGLSGDYKCFSWLKAGAGYDLLDDRNPSQKSYHKKGSVNKYTPPYWGLRHRFHADLTGSVKWQDFQFSLRERWQYTYRPEKTIRRYDMDDEEWEDKVKSGKGKNLLRSRFTVDYHIPKSDFEPYAEVEAYQARSLEKLRYTMGVGWKITSHHQVEVYYRYQDVRGDDDDSDQDIHILGLGYIFKF